MRPILSKVNKRFELNGLTTLYFEIVVPNEKASEIRRKLNIIIDWFMSRNRLKALNKRDYDSKLAGTLRLVDDAIIADSTYNNNNGGSD